MKYVILLAIMLAGCSTPSTGNYESKLHSWVGRTSVDLVQGWGVPQNTMNLPDGTKVYEYVWNGGARVVATSTGADSDRVYCKTTFYLGADDKVAKWRHEGNACRSE